MTSHTQLAGASAEHIKKVLKKLLQDFFMLDYQDSNLDKQNQKLLCYHYTIVQTYVLSV